MCEDARIRGFLHYRRTSQDPVLGVLPITLQKSWNQIPADYQRTSRVRLQVEDSRDCAGVDYYYGRDFLLSPTKHHKQILLPLPTRTTHRFFIRQDRSSLHPRRCTTGGSN